MRILYSKGISAQQIMDRDAELLEDLRDEEQPFFHFYQWPQPAASHGYFFRPEEHLNLAGVEQVGLNLARRPTGGGMLFHLSDMAFSFFLPASHPLYSLNTLENYHTVNQVVIAAIEQFSNEIFHCTLLQEEPEALDDHCKQFCMAKPTQYDVVFQGKKLGGAAQRRKRWGLLHQGSISLLPPEKSLLDSVLLPSSRVQEGFFAHSGYLCPELQAVDLLAVQEKLQNCLIESFVSKFF